MKTLFVTFKTKDQETTKALKDALLNLKALSALEEGLVQYEVFQAEDDALTHYVRESWSSEATFQKHIEQPHLKQFFNLSEQLLAEPFTTISLKSLTA